jgi:hypothetical protein
MQEFVHWDAQRVKKVSRVSLGLVFAAIPASSVNLPHTTGNEYSTRCSNLIGKRALNIEEGDRIQRIAPRS